MKIITIGTDENLLVQNSRTYNRVRDYATLADEYLCLVFTKNKKAKVIAEIVDGKKFVVTPIYGRNKIIQVINLLKFFKSTSTSPNLSLQRRGIEQVVLSSQDAFEIGLLSYFIAKQYGFKLSIQMHTDISTKFFSNESLRNYMQYLIAKFVLKKADTIRVVSKKMEKYLVDNLKIKKEKVFWLPIYTDVSRFEFFHHPQHKPIKILMISRIEEVKNIPLGIRAVQAFRKLSREDVKLRIVGKGNLKEKYLKEFKNKDWIEWADWTENVEEEYHNADLLLITSNYEGWGLTAVESVACGTPVVISPVGVANEFIISGVNGFVAGGHDVVNIMEAIYNAIKYEFEEEKMKKSLESLDTKQEFLEKMKSMLYS